MEADREQLANTEQATVASNVTVTGGNNDALIAFPVKCADGSDNHDASPCDGGLSSVTVALKNADSEFAAMTTSVTASHINCYNTAKGAGGAPCSGAAGETCKCYISVGGLPMYENMRATVTANYAADNTTGIAPASQQMGTSLAFTLLDIVTPKLLNDLYDVPYGQGVRHGNGVGVNAIGDVGIAGFYHEYFSVNDLDTFMTNSGRPITPIPIVKGDGMGRNETDPGGEGQLDVEVVGGLTGGQAQMVFYSMNGLNPYSPDNEGFLSWLYLLGNSEFEYGDEGVRVVIKIK